MKKKIENILKQLPGLKGREIARKIGVERKKVNSFLHRHTDTFQQNDEYCWFLIDQETRTVTLEVAWVTSDSFENSLNEAGCLLSSDCSSVLIVVPEGCKIMLIAAARLLALLNQLIYIGKTVTVDLTACAGTNSFLSRAGFFDHLDQKVDIIPKRPMISGARIYKGNSDTLVEFGSIDPVRDNKSLIVQLGDLFVQQSDTRYETAALTVFSELIGNVREHSETPIHGFAALQKYGGIRKHIQTVVSDSGLGISKTLRPSLKSHYPGLYKRYKEDSIVSDAGLVRTALSKGEISRFGSGRGLGFKSSRKQAMKFDAELTVRQEHFCLSFKYENGELVNVEKRLDIPRILGSHFCFDFFVDPE